MTLATESVATRALTLPDELLLMLLNEDSGYFRQVPGWDLNCAVVGAVLAELSLISRIDTDMDSLILLDKTPTGDAALDDILREIADEPAQQNAQYWIERLAPHAESIIDVTLERLVAMQILQYHDGEFWTLSRIAWQRAETGDSQNGSTEFVTTRIGNVLYNNEIPDPRDVIIIALANTCDVLRFVFPIEEEHEERVELICRMDLIGRAIADAVANNLAGPLLRRATLTKEIPTVPLHKVLLNRHLRRGNLPGLFADLAEEYGPVFRLNPPFLDTMTFLAGPETNRWAHRHGRTFLRAKDYLQEFEKVYGASGILPSLDGADHFRFRKSLQPAYSRARLEGQLDTVFTNARAHMATWKVGDAFPACPMSRKLINSQISPLMLSVQSQDLLDDLSVYKERALATRVVKVLPKFMLNTPGMKRKARGIETLLDRVQGIHTPAQRAGCPRDLADDLLSLHASDPQFLPESNLRFALSAPLIASVYLGDGLSFALYAMATQPDLYERIRAEADALFADGDPSPEDFTLEAIDTTHRFIMESMRIYPIVPVSIRTVMNACVVEGYELPEGSEIHIAQTASHYMSDVFPDPEKFDIDRYLPPRDEHRGPGYAPYGLGTHTCLGSRWMELQLSANLLMLAHYFTIKVSPENKPLRINPFPSLSISKRIKFVIAEKRREIPT
ncbi:MAG: cytochrome P450 [Dehalococcoidia bacterium]|nr:cytochrome P450 [Dehalococcoidia bacterium]MYK27035.1 cytochrome P450 [Dehalococcoidia bacterium]